MDATRPPPAGAEAGAGGRGAGDRAASKQQTAKGDVFGLDLTLNETAGETLMTTTELRRTLIM